LNTWLATSPRRTRQLQAAEKLIFSVPLRRYSLEVSLGLGELQIPRLPGFPVELGGISELHAAFFKESRTRGHLWYRVVGNPGPLGMTKERAVVTVEDSFHGLNRLRKNSGSGRKDVPQDLRG
jgi:hypothetical protein